MIEQYPTEPGEAPAGLPRPALARAGVIRELLSTLALVLAIFSLVELAIPRFIVDGPSMQPNFGDGQFLIISRMQYIFSTPQRGDIIVFNVPGAPASDPPLIKRVIGVPGDVVEIRDRLVYVNAVQLYEPYINEPCNEYRCADRRWELGTDQYFVMGDNRNHSNDSRSFGPIDSSHIIGEAVIRYWPPQAWGIVTQINFPDNSAP